MLPEEFSRPPEERPSDDRAEFAPLPEEFGSGTIPAEPKKKRKFTQLAAGAIAAVIAIAVFRSAPPVSVPVETEPTEQPIPIIETIPPTQPPTEPQPTEPPFEPMVLDRYDNPGGVCIITVYGDYFDFDTFSNPVLMEITVQESEFTELELPEQPVHDGCSVMDYVIEYSEISADFQSTGYNPGSGSFARSVGLSLTLDEIQLVPVWEEDQIRHVYVHPVWVRDSGHTDWEYAPVITLDTGDKTVEFPMDLPLASGGVFYVCAVIPEREGYSFAGWYNEREEIVYAICAEDLFTQYLDGTENIDWTKPTNVTLTAKWVENS